MPPKRMEDQPMIDTACGSHAPEANDHIGTRTRHNVMLRRLVQEKGKLPLAFHNCDGRPTGTYAAMFTTELGLVVKTFAPLQVEEWKDVTEENKKPMFDQLQNFFDVDFGTGPDSVRKETNIWMGDRYRDNRTKMHKHYQKHIHLPWEVRLAKSPKRFYGDESDWAYLCTLFESEKFKAR